MVTWSDIVLFRKKKKKTICSSDKEENCLKCGKTPALLAIFAKVTAKDINKLSV